MTCDRCRRANCRVAFWTSAVRRLEEQRPAPFSMPRPLDAPRAAELEGAYRGLAAARVSCFIRAGQRRSAAGS